MPVSISKDKSGKGYDVSTPNGVKGEKMTLRKPSPIGPAIMPTVTNTIAAEIGDRSETRENSPNPKINKAAKMKIG